MADYGPSTYGDRIAEVYDDWFSVPHNTADTVAFLADLAAGGPALELGIGTGRVALPLAARGIEVTGIDASAAMVAKLRAKPGGDKIHIVMTDFADVPIDGRFKLIYVVFNTFFALLTQDAQVRCFARIAEHLTDGGVFVMSAFIPDLARFDRGQRTATPRVGTDVVYLEASNYDPKCQTIHSQHVVISEAGIRMYPIQLRYAWPSELDLMARLAGMRLRSRFGGWNRELFTGAPTSNHVSVYEPAKR